MKKFGLSSKKDRPEEEDPNRNRLFGNRKPKSPAPPSTNPYAVPQSSGNPDPYAQSTSSYAQSAYSESITSKAPSYTSQPPAYSGGGYGGYGGSDNDYTRQTRPTAGTGGYGASGGGGYGGGGYGNSGNYGGQQAYGENRYGDFGSSAPSRPGGYGGMGRSYSQETTSTDAGRDALFGGARERFEQKKAQNNGLAPDEAAGGYGGAAGGETDGYGQQRDRQLTAEEEEEEEVEATKQQIRAIKQQDVSSTRNALRIAEQAEQTGRETLERLGAQGERIHNTEKNLDLASNQNRVAEEKAKELKHLNRSMWAMHVNNPFTKKQREQERDDQILRTHHEEKDRREATRAAAYDSASRQQGFAKDLNRPGDGAKRGNLAERSKYQFEADSEDEAMEEEIDQNLDLLHGAAGRLNQLGRAMGKEVDSQNEHIRRITGKTDLVDDQILMNRSRLDRIK